MTVLQMIESMLGRDRANEVRWGPRTLDLDVLLWGTRTIATPELVVPHPRMTARRFVLAPLIELFGEELLVGEHTLGQLIRAADAVRLRGRSRRVLPARIRSQPRQQLRNGAEPVVPVPLEALQDQLRQLLRHLVPEQPR